MFCFGYIGIDYIVTESVRIPGLGLSPINGLNRKAGEGLQMGQIVDICSMILRGRRRKGTFIQYLFC